MSSNSKATARSQKAAEMRAAQKKREARRRILTITGVVAVMALIIGGSILVSVLNKKEVKAAAAGSSAYGVTIGKKDAPHSIVIYEDFLCPFCRQLESATRSKLEGLAADGKVFVEYRPFNLLGGEGRTYPIRAAGAFSIVLEKSGPEVAKKFHDLLFEHQPSEQNADAEGPDSDLVKYAVEAGANEADVKAAIEAGEGADWVTKATKEAQDSGVGSTPTVLLDGQVFEDGRTIQDRANSLIDAVD
ncbi:thioredoxin domain-containing protein [Pimelobacter sp. 30-1]|uniref:DsbA family protein n=1 Tax=Pimelobacter sp. 30-1 TaxID=2004991 RepID=UPI001C0522B2|nr:thioredoxin domain-containing protein [Pimelobacter sp. 30-1]MBU2697783.1 disulfide bond formation protein DsbA [Pimelobacter sp. 30-1]